MKSTQVHTNAPPKQIEPAHRLEAEPVRRPVQRPAQSVALQAVYWRAQVSRNGLTPANLLALQRAMGNRAVQRMAGQRSDIADNRISYQNQILRRVELIGEEEEEKIQVSPQARMIQRQNVPAARTQNLKKLDELLDETDVDEEKVITLLKDIGNNEEEKNAVIYGGYKKKIANALNASEMVRAMSNLKPHIAIQLEWIDASVVRTSSIDYSDIRELITSAPKSQKDALKTIGWRDFFVKVCTNETMPQAVKDLGFDLKTRLEWMKEEGTDWPSVKAQILETTDANEKIALYDSAEILELMVKVCNDEEMAEAVVRLGGTEKQQRQWMDAEGADWTLVLARLQYEHLEAERKKEEDQQRKAAEEAAKERGEAKPESVPEVTIGEVVGKEVEKGKIPTSPTSSWDTLSEEQKKDWEEKRAPEAWKKLLNSVKSSELGKVMEDVDYQFSPRYALEKTAYAWQTNNVLGFGMQFVQDIEHDPNIVWPVVAHEMGGHVEYGKTYASEIMEKALELMPKDVRKRWQNDRKAHQEFFEAYEYPETEIFAALRQLRYEEPLSGAKPTRRPMAIHPHSNIPFRLSQIKDRYHPDVAKAILKELKRRVDDSSGILERDKKYLADQIKRIFGYTL